MEKELMKSVLQKVQTEIKKEFDKTFDNAEEHALTLSDEDKITDNHLNIVHGKMCGLVFVMNIIFEMAKDLNEGKPISEWSKG